MRMGKLLGHEAPDVAEAVQQSRHHDVAGQALLRQVTQGGRHGLGHAATIGVEHFDQTDVAGGAGADELLEARPGTRHDDRPFVERQDLAERVVAAHGDDAGRLLHQGAEVVGEGERADVRELRGALLEGLARSGRHERAEHDDRAIGNVRIGLIGSQHPVDQFFAVAAAAGRDQDEGTIDLLHLVRHVAVQRQFAPQIAGVDHLVPNRRWHVDAGQRLVDLRQAVHPDLVVEVAQRRYDVLALPLLRELGGIVHHVAQAEHQRRAALLEKPQRRADLAAQAERLLVDDEEIRPVDVGGVADDAGAHLERMLDVHAQVRRIVLAGFDLHHAGNTDEIDARTEFVGADDRRAGQDQHRNRLVGFDDGIGDGAAATHMAEAERIVAVEKHTLGSGAGGHWPLPRRSGYCPDR